MKLRERRVAEFIRERMLTGQVKAARIGDVYLWVEPLKEVVFVHIGSKEEYERHRDRLKRDTYP